MNRRDIFPRSLQYLIAIAEHGSYTRAAEVLHVSQPSLSQQIKLLEEALQTSLLDRSEKRPSGHRNSRNTYSLTLAIS